MLIEQTSGRKHRTVPKWLWITAAIFLAAILTGIVILVTHWPFTRANVTEALESASGHSVQIRTFSATYVPPGCSVEGIRFLRHNNPGAPPIITVDKLTIQGSLTGMFASPKRLSAVRIVGMRMQIPPKPSDSDDKTKVLLNSGPGGKGIAISRITADGALLEFLPKEPGGKPYRLKIDQLAITGVGSGAPMSYRATLTNTRPPGTIRAQGEFGPWNPEDVGATPVSGAYTYDNIELGAFEGVFGTGHARGSFSGPLSRIHTQGTVDVEKFHVDGGDHPVQLATTFDALVNGTSGDVFLNPAAARYRNTQVVVRGWIAGHPGTQGKTAAFDIAVPKGRLEDLLLLFDKGQPGMSGHVTLNGRLLWPPGPRKFLEKIRLDVSFGMSGSRFAHRGTQDSIDRVSESAQGESKRQEDEDSRTVLSQIRGKIVLRSGLARITEANFEVPGAYAAVQGTYNVLTHTVDLHGTLDTKGHLSDTTTSFKALVLKAVTPLFKKKNSVRIIPFQITGAYGNTAVTIDWKRNLRSTPTP